MVGVKNADDARAVVDDYHVGGIFIGSWTDLSMLTNGPLADIAAHRGAAAAGGQRRRRGRPGVAVEVADRAGAVAQGAGSDAKRSSRSTTWRSSRGRQMHDLGITVDFAPVVESSPTRPTTA